MPDWMPLYNRLPYPLRVVAASSRGYYLRAWRYGGSSGPLVDEALERDTWSEARWEAWREERLAYVLHRAATEVPYYRRQWSSRRKQGDRSSWEELVNWPVLKKEALRVQPHAFIAEECDHRRMYHLQTSGTTGKPLHLWRSRETDRRWYALYEARCRRWNGVSFLDRWAMIGGQIVTPFSQTRPPFWVWNAGLGQLYMSSLHLAPRHIPQYVGAMIRYRVDFVLGYASALYAIASGMLDGKIAPPPVRVVMSNAEPLYDHQRSVVETAFDCPVVDAYGMCEIAAAASECTEGNMHLWPEVGVLEVMQHDSTDLAAPGQTGRFITTGLLNADMPLIRYEVGDLGSVAPAQMSCSCGRHLPVLQSVEGRLDDVIVTPDGRRIGRLDPVFKADLPVRATQVIQISETRLDVRIVPAAGYNEAHALLITKRLRDRVGDMEINLESVDQIARTDSGKLRGVISMIRIDDGHSASAL